METTPLETSIREESERTIRAIREHEAAEIRQLDEACTLEIEGYRGRTGDEIQARIDQELKRIASRGILERRKLMLRTIEEFITRTVEKAVEGMRSDPLYKEFLLQSICAATLEIQSGAEVHLKEQDRIFDDEIMAALKDAGVHRDIVIRDDSTIQWGGCLVRDEAGGRIFNGTIERIYYRKSAMIRREVLRILKDKGFTL